MNKDEIEELLDVLTELYQGIPSGIRFGYKAHLAKLTKAIKSLPEKSEPKPS